MKNKGVRFYKPKNDLCSVWDNKQKIIFNLYSIKEATKLLKVLNKLYYQEEIKNAERERSESKSKT